LAVGLIGVLAVGQLIGALLVEAGGVDAMVLSGIVLALATITAAACFGPTRRAVRLDPITALRHD
jgi:ABC-type antimicrobial peptide transport system permease subunit